MSGICGILSTNNKLDPELLQRMSGVIDYRGRDDEGYVLFADRAYQFGGKYTREDIHLQDISQCDVPGAYLGFAQRKYFLYDPSEECHQPMCDDENSLYITFCGRIYNSPALREELIGCGVRFNTHGDTEVILKAYLTWGEKCVERFNGTWAFAIWDEGNRKLFCSRDRMGAKPFSYFYSREKGLFIFGSEIKQIIQSDKVSRVLNEKVMAANLVFGLRDYDEDTLIEQVKDLRPAHALSIVLCDDCTSIKSFNIYKYWELDVNCNDTPPKEGYIKRISRRIDEAIATRINDTQRYGAFLSGGLDSSMIVSKICSQLKNSGKDVSEFQTFSMKFENDSRSDESHYAHLVNESCGCRETMFEPQITDFQKEVENAVWHVEGDGAIATIHGGLMAQLAFDRGLRVIINGQGGDETMFGYDKYFSYYFADLLKKMKLVTFFREFKNASKHSRMNAWILFKTILFYKVPALNIARSKQLASRYYKDDVLKNVDTASLRSKLFFKNAEDMQRNEITGGQVPFVLRMDDRFYSARGIESRIPLLDHNYVEEAVRIPICEKIHNGFSKSIMREMMSGLMPDEVTWRTKKMGFPAPFGKWFLEADKEYINGLFENCRSEKYFKTDKLKKEYESGVVTPAFMEFVNYEVFMRLFDIKSPDTARSKGI